MQTTIKIVGVYIGSLILVSCSQPNGHKNFDLVDYDTLTIQNKELDKTKISNTYTKRFGILMDDYYSVDDSIGLNLNGTKNIDTILVLTPRNLLTRNVNSMQIDTTSKRLVVVISYHNGMARITGIYPNLISDSGELTSKYNGIYKINYGFEIRQKFGNKYRWEYITKYHVGDAGLILLNAIEKTCIYDTLFYNVQYQYNNIPVTNISILDSVNNNCDCDSIWHNLGG